MAEKKPEQYYTPPPKLGKWEGFKIFLWNSETSQFMGRTGSSWAKIILFYVIFYTALIGFFAAMLAIFYQTLDAKVPKWQLDSSIIGSNPGLGFRPMPPESNVESTLIWFKGNDPSNYKYWTEELDSFLSVYKKEHESTSAENRVECSYKEPPPPGKVCNVQIEQWKPCVPEEQYNYNKHGPCIFLKLNKIFSWKPQVYNNTDDLPHNMPAHLQSYIKDKVMAQKEAMNTVWVNCEGENPADVENIGAIKYYPHRGFPGYFFPFMNNEGYLSPLVAVNFEQPKRGVLINIECKAWAHNIHHDRIDRRGSVHFELMVD
jgi:sodium/potassium-transporting ATPase subunit beta